MMQQIRDNAKYVVSVAVVCFLGLIFVDWGMSPSNSLTHKTVVGTVGGYKIPLLGKTFGGEDIQYTQFDERVQNRAKQMTEQGRELDGAAYAELRKAVLDEMVRERVLAAAYRLYNLQGTPEEVLDYLKRNPPPGVDKAPIFKGPDSVFNPALYHQWLSSPKAFEEPMMRMLEAQITEQALPEAQLRKLLAAGQPATDLEAAFRARRELTHVWGVWVAARADSFAVDSSKVSDAQVKAYFDANTDSFYVSKATARVPVAVLRKAPSKADSLMAWNEVDSVSIRAKAGENFEDLAKSYSEDPGSAAQGGKLGGFQSLKRWVPEFAVTARTLSEGQISAPVLSRFGWHILRCNGRKVEAADTLFDLSHILISVQTSPETVDSLKEALEALRTAVRAKTDFATAAKAAGAEIETVTVAEGDLAQVGTGPITGVSAYAFKTMSNEPTSEVLEAEHSLAVVGQGEIRPAGRDFESAKPRILHSLALNTQVEQAEAHLAAVAPKFGACDTTASCFAALGKVSATVLSDRPLETYAEGLGFADPAFFKTVQLAKAKKSTWVGPAKGVAGAGWLRIDSVVEPKPEAVAVAAAEGRNRFAWKSARAFDEWYDLTKSAAGFSSNLDMYFRD